MHKHRLFVQQFSLMCCCEKEIQQDAGWFGQGYDLFFGIDEQFNSQYNLTLGRDFKIIHKTCSIFLQSCKGILPLNCAKVSVALSNPYDLWWFINATTPGLYTV